MVSAGIGTLNLGIGFREIMMMATAITFLFALFHAVTPVEGGGYTFDVWSLPGGTWTAFNTLWFDDFKWLESGGGVCMAAINSTSYMTGTELVEVVNSTMVGGGYLTTNETEDDYASTPDLHYVHTSPFGFLLDFGATLGANIGYYIGYTGLDTSAAVSGLADVFNVVPSSVVGFVNFVINAVGGVYGIIVGCGSDGFSGFRLVIGCAIAGYWSVQLLMLLGNLSSVFEAIWKIIG